MISDDSRISKNNQLAKIATKELGCSVTLNGVDKFFTRSNRMNTEHIEIGFVK
jgi:hypothetical protein